MARQTFTDRTLKALKPAPAGGRYDLFDAVVSNLGVRITDKGKKTFVLLARFPPSSNPTRRALGEYPALELAAARDKARQWLDLIGRGIDPAVKVEEEKQERDRAAVRKKDRSFETILARYIAGRRRDGVKKADEDERDFKRECLPLWQGRDVADLSMADILRVVEGIRDRGKVRQALNMAQKIGTFLSWCADDDLIPVSPYRPKRVRIAIGEKQARDRVLSNAEIATFWQATATLDPARRDIYRLLLLTGQRLNDICQASWHEIDRERRTLTIQASRFKSGRDHVVPLTDDAWAILEGVTPRKDCPWIFTHGGNRPVAMQTGPVKQRLDRAIAVLSDGPIPAWCNHDLRRTMRTHLSELDIMDEVAEAVIGHAPPQLVRTYNQSDRLRVKLDALNRWQGALRLIVDPAAAKDNVVAIR